MSVLRKFCRPNPFHKLRSAGWSKQTQVSFFLFVKENSHLFCAQRWNVLFLDPATYQHLKPKCLVKTWYVFFSSPNVISIHKSPSVGALSKHHLKPNIWADNSHKLLAIASKRAAFLSKIHQPPHFHWLLISIYTPWREIMKTRCGGGGKPGQAFRRWTPRRRRRRRRTAVYRVCCSAAAVPAAVPWLRKGQPQ